MFFFINSPCNICHTVCTMIKKVAIVAVTLDLSDPVLILDLTSQSDILCVFFGTAFSLQNEDNFFLTNGLLTGK
jgi:hypothetical protein